jgi:DNA polymerase III sliding clamp (beta) subunit (PCNA family)
MEIKAKRGDLLATLYWTQSIVERRNTMPILANVLLESQKKDIRVTATDLEVGVRGSLEGDVVKEGSVTVNAKKLYEIVREVPNEHIQLDSHNALNGGHRIRERDKSCHARAPCRSKAEAQPLLDALISRMRNIKSRDER